MLKLGSAALVAAAAGLVAPAAGFAGDLRVATRDLDLTQPAGVRRLDHRIADAVARVCGRDDARDIGRVVAARTCMRETRADLAARRGALIAAGSASRQVAAAR